jgi:putative transposase
LGGRRAYWRLRQAGEVANHKRLQRLCKPAGLAVVRRKKKRYTPKQQSSAPCKGQYPNHLWSYDSLEDVLLWGKKYRLLHVLDEFTRQWLGLRVGFSVDRQSVVAVLEPLFAEPGIARFLEPGIARFLEPGIARFLGSDKGPEFIAREGKAWLASWGSGPLDREPGKPWQNGHAERFGGKRRAACLDREGFVSLGEAEVSLECVKKSLVTG